MTPSTLGGKFSVALLGRSNAPVSILYALDSAVHASPGMTPQELRERTERFVRAIVEFATPLMRKPVTSDVARQLLRAATSVGANYRSAGRGRSHAEFTAKIGLVLEEADECLYWLELLRDSALATGDELEKLVQEARELVAIFSASRRTAIKNRRTRDRAISRSKDRQSGNP